jgi:Fur family peroxide stress response transcriptional regulator
MAKTDEKARVRAMLDDLKRAGLKLTAQREAIVRQFAADPTHPTAQDLYDRLRGDYPQMSFATVYNTLDALAAAGLSGTLRIGNAARFDPNTLPHHHVVCERCGAVGDLPVRTLDPSPAAIRNVRRAAPGFSVRSVERVYKGLCASCQRSDEPPSPPRSGPPFGQHPRSARMKA